MIDLLPRPLDFPSQLAPPLIWGSGNRAANQFPIKNRVPLENARDISHDNDVTAA
jgi:hypothetical protein